MGELATPVILSLRPRFAWAILDGSKSVELRRQRIAAPRNTLIILYASSPVMAVVGTARVEQIVEARPNLIWAKYEGLVGLDSNEFHGYLTGAERATALVLSDAKRLDVPIRLASLRESEPFRPPQSYRYLTGLDPQVLHQLVETREGQEQPLQTLLPELVLPNRGVRDSS